MLLASLNDQIDSLNALVTAGDSSQPVQDQISDLQSQRTDLIYTMLSNDMNNGLVEDAIEWLTAEGEMRLAIPLMISNGDFSDAIIALGNFPNDSLDDQQFIQLESMLIDLGEDSLTIYDMNSSQKELVHEIATTRTPTSYDTRNILEAVEGKHYAEDIPGEDNEYIKWLQQQSEEIYKATILEIYPNPNYGEFIVKYQVTTDEALDLFVSDVAGKKIFQLRLPTEQNTLDLDLSGLPAAPYFIGIINGHTISSVNKIIILKQ